MSTIIFTRGLPGSGKSTFAKEWVADDPDNRIRVNRDDIRRTLGIRSGIGTQRQEENVSLIEHASVEAAVKAGKDVIVDAMNLNPRFMRQWLKFADKHGAEVGYADFPVSVYECMARDQERAATGGRLVGAKVIDQIANKWGVKDDGTLPEPPKWTPKPKPDLTPIAAWDDELPTAIIVDVDGTLANHVGIRNPYDTSKYHLDTLHENVATVVNALAYSMWMIVVSGRDAAFQPILVEWLRDKRVHYDELHMRPEGDRRPDDVVKAELYEQNIRGRYNVLGVFDDRGRVLRMWRAKGFTTFAVGDTDNNDF